MFLPFAESENSIRGIVFVFLPGSKFPISMIFFFDFGSVLFPVPCKALFLRCYNDLGNSSFKFYSNMAFFLIFVPNRYYLAAVDELNN